MALMETRRALLLTLSKRTTISLAIGNAPGRARRKRRRSRSASNRWLRISLSASPKMNLLRLGQDPLALV
eukprot:10486309-Heterocapsa_arctica.AAC.1